MKLKSKKSALLLSFTSLLLCFAMLAGSTFAWFTDTATTGVNKIVSGKLKVDIVDENGVHLNDLSFQDKDSKTNIRWEPGVKFLTQGFKIKNDGNLALKWKMAVNKGVKGETDDFDLKDVIDFSIVTIDNTTGTPVEKEVDLAAFEGKLPSGMSEVYYLKGHMQESAGNDYQNLSLNDITVTVYATQDTVENDSFNNTYDENATYYPVLDAAGLKDALVNGGEIQVVEDVKTSGENTVEARMIVSKPTTLQLDKKIISPDDMGNNNTNFVALIVDADTTINAGPEGGIDTGTNGGYAINVRNGATLTINSGDYYGGGTAVQVQEGELIINGGFFAVEPYSDARYGYNFLLNCIDGNYKNGTAKIIVKGGTFVNFDPSNNTAEGAGTNFVAEGYSVISEQHGADTWYTVVRAAGSADTLKAAIGEGAPYIQLTENVDVSEVLTFNHETTIDLNGKTLSSSVNSDGNSLVLKGDTVIKNGTYQGTGTARGIMAWGNLTLENVKVDVAGLVGVACSKENCTYSIQDSEIKGDYALANFANNATVTIQGSTLEGKTCGLYHNGTNHGLNLNVTDTTINGGNGEETTGVYISGSTATVAAGGYQQATFTDCTIEGATAVEVKHSDVKLTGCTLTATGDPTSYTKNNNGSTAVGYCFATTSNSTDGQIDPSSGTIEFDSCTFLPKVSGCEVFNSYADASGNRGATINGYDNSKILYPNKLTPNP